MVQMVVELLWRGSVQVKALPAYNRALQPQRCQRQPRHLQRVSDQSRESRAGGLQAGRLTYETGDAHSPKRDNEHC